MIPSLVLQLLLENVITGSGEVGEVCRPALTADDGKQLLDSTELR